MVLDSPPRSDWCAFRWRDRRAPACASLEARWAQRQLRAEWTVREDDRLVARTCSGPPTDAELSVMYCLLAGLVVVVLMLGVGLLSILATVTELMMRCCSPIHGCKQRTPPHPADSPADPAKP